MDYRRVHKSDLEKISDALEHAVEHHEAKDEMNAALHLSEPRYSPLTTLLRNAYSRTRDILDEINAESID